jgi:murein DD-endopeptidase MepM/ murein hydrolase activator NlpD
VYSASHPGIDIDEYPNGDNPVLAIAAGTVTFAGGNACCSYGLYVIVKHADGYTSLYSHLSSIGVSEGQEVKQGASLGKSGNTGFSTGVHVHLEIRKDGVAIDPLTLLPGPFNLE